MIIRSALSVVATIFCVAACSASATVEPSEEVGSAATVEQDAATVDCSTYDNCTDCASIKGCGWCSLDGGKCHPSSYEATCGAANWAGVPDACLSTDASAD